ncbi:hypothetical protein MNV49_006656 [Pseudohyphozyma bogoriensis]|nr:hypothetical protein MNV49_006656 [Pseudohyphozyma bogoriensis]
MNFTTISTPSTPPPLEAPTALGLLPHDDIHTTSCTGAFGVKDFTSAWDLSKKPRGAASWEHIEHTSLDLDDQVMGLGLLGLDGPPPSPIEEKPGMGFGASARAPSFARELTARLCGGLGMDFAPKLQYQKKKDLGGMGRGLWGVAA